MDATGGMAEEMAGVASIDYSGFRLEGQEALVFVLRAIDADYREIVSAKSESSALKCFSEASTMYARCPGTANPCPAPS